MNLTIQAVSRRFTLLWVMVAFSLCMAFPGWTQSSSDTDILKKTQEAFASVAKKASPAVVFVEVQKLSEVSGPSGQFDPFDFFGQDFFDRFFRDRFPDRRNPDRKEKPSPKPRLRTSGEGSGFIISQDGYILSNNHVVGGADKVKVKLADGREFTAKVIGSDKPSDVGLIKIDATNLPYLPLGDSDDIEVGNWVMAIGSPFGLTQTVTSGIISAKGRSNVGITEYEDFIQTDAAINPGNSGGPLLNLDGKVIGINTAIVSQTGGYMGIGFAIPINMAKSVYDQLMKSGSVTRGYLGIGIQELTPDLAKSFNISETSGILVGSVIKDSPAEKAGIKQGDVIIELDGNPVKDNTSFRNKIASTSPGSSVDLRILRDGEKKTISVTIAKKPAEIGGEESGTTPEKSTDITDKLGFEVQDLTSDLAERFDYKIGEGVIVSSVEPGSPAAEQGIRPGTLIQEVNRKPVKNLEQFHKALIDAGKKNSILFLVRDEKFSRYVVLKLE